MSKINVQSVDPLSSAKNKTRTNLDDPLRSGIIMATMTSVSLLLATTVASAQDRNYGAPLSPDDSSESDYETYGNDSSYSYKASTDEFCRKSQDPNASDSERTISGVLCILLPCAMMKDGQCNFDAVMQNPIESHDNTWEGRPISTFTARMSPVDTGFVGFSYNLGFGFDKRTMSFGEDESTGTSFHYLLGLELDFNTQHTDKSSALLKPEFFAGGYMGFTDFYTPNEDHPETPNDPDTPSTNSWNVPNDSSRDDISAFAGAQGGIRIYLTHIYVTGGVDYRQYMAEIPVLDKDGNLVHEEEGASTTYFFGAGLSF